MPRRYFLVVFVAFFCSFVTGTAAAATLPRPAANLLRAVNTARRAHGTRPLRLDWTLTDAARDHSTDMLAHDYFAHGDFAARMTAFHVRGLRMGENLAWGSGPYARATMVVREWLGSPEHRANLLDRRFVRIGVGVVRGSFQGVENAAVVTADFAG